MNAYRVKPMRFPWTPVVYLVAILLSIALHRVAAIAVADSWLIKFEMLGAVVAAAGVWLSLWGFIKLIRSHTAILPSSPATHLVTSGPYRFTRNPVYLGYTMAMFGTGLLIGNIWMSVIAALTAVVTHAWIIRSEERHLLARFGFEFECYCRRTRAWI